MKIKPAIKPGHVTVELDSRDDELLEKAANTPKSAASALKLKRILVPIDFSECAAKAVDYAAVFAEHFQAKLILLHVVEPAVYPENFLVLPLPLDETNQNLVETARERLDGLARKRIGHKVPVETLVRAGRACSEIPDTARALGADLIIIGTHGYTGLKHALLGSTAERVVRHAACPVLTVRHPEHAPAPPH
jgi:universal stress protein A